MEDNFKKTQNNTTNQRLEFEKSTKTILFIVLFLFKLGIIKFLILTYFYTQEDINFELSDIAKRQNILKVWSNQWQVESNQVLENLRK
jgi:hypothetical protein